MHIKDIFYNIFLIGNAILHIFTVYVHKTNLTSFKLFNGKYLVSEVNFWIIVSQLIYVQISFVFLLLTTSVHESFSKP